MNFGNLSSITTVGFASIGTCSAEVINGFAVATRASSGALVNSPLSFVS